MSQQEPQTPRPAFYEYADEMWTPVAEDDIRQDTEIDALQAAEVIDRALLINLAGRVDITEDDIDSLKA